MKNILVLFGLTVAFVSTTASSSFAAGNDAYKALAHAYKHAKKPTELLFATEKTADCLEIDISGEITKSTFVFSKRGPLIIANETDGGYAEYIFAPRSWPHSSSYAAEAEFDGQKIKLEAKESLDGNLLIKMTGAISMYISCAVQSN